MLIPGIALLAGESPSSFVGSRVFDRKSQFVERIGLVGLANSGKSALFNALTNGSAMVAAHPFSTTESVTGVAIVADSRLDALAKISASRKVVAAHVEFTDIAGLVAGSSSGEGLGNRFLAGVREMDALCLVVRAFHDDNVSGDTDPLDALAVLELELVMADHATCEAHLDRRRRTARVDKSAAEEVEALEVALKVLGEGTPIYRSGLPAEVVGNLRNAFLLTNKPVFAVVNIGEEQLAEADEIASEVSEALGANQQAICVSVELEAELARMDSEGRAEMLAGLELGEGALARVAQAAYHLLGRRTFFTTGDKESRAWTFRAGAKAPECAGVIHSDLQRGFIRAEVIHWDELIALGSWNAAKAVGKLRLEGKEYEVLDGDVLEIRFNVSK